MAHTTLLEYAFHKEEERATSCEWRKFLIEEYNPNIHVLIFCSSTELSSFTMFYSLNWFRDLKSTRNIYKPNQMKV